MQKVAKVSVTVPKAAKGQKRASKVQRAIDYVRGILLAVATNIFYPLLNAPTPPSNAAAKAKMADLTLDQKRALVAAYVKYIRSAEFKQMRAKLIATSTPPTYTQIQDAMNALQAQQDIVKAGSTKADTSLLKDLYNVLFEPVVGLIVLAGDYVTSQGGTNLATLLTSGYAITQTIVSPINELAQPSTPTLEPPTVNGKLVSGSLEVRLPEGVENADRYLYNLVQTLNKVPVTNGLTFSPEEKQTKYKFAGLPSGTQFMVTVIAKGRRAGVVSTESGPAYCYTL